MYIFTIQFKIKHIITVFLFAIHKRQQRKVWPWV